MVGNGETPTLFCSMTLFLSEISQPRVQEEQYFAFPRSAAWGGTPQWLPWWGSIWQGDM